jgi:epoxyqueuosine reductase
MIPSEDWFPPFPEDLAPLFDSHGLRLVGVADAVPLPQELTRFEQWLAQGRGGGMGWLARHAPLKFSPEKLLPGCRSILFAALNYYQKRSRAPAAVPSGRVARYAWGRDYHKTLGGRLKRVARELERRWPSDRFAAAADATPLGERAYAERAGIGFTGRNTLLISSAYGSWFVLGEILSTRAFAASGEVGGRHGACPSGCRRCLDVCPTGALTGPREIDASRCISYMTIEHKGSIPEDLRPLIGEWLFGCDLCQEVCPLNVRAQVTEVEDFVKVNAGDTPALARILALRDHADVSEAFGGSPLMRAGRRGLVRNACIVAANTGAAELLPELRRLAADADAVIAEHAGWAVSVLEAAAGPPPQPSITPQPRQTSPS